MKNIAIILAAGSGTRFDKKLPKQYHKLAGKLVFEYTIEAFEKNLRIDEIIIVINENYEHIVSESIIKNSYIKTRIVYGGQTRIDSTQSAVITLKNEPDNCKILLHDSVRPLVSQRIINECINALDEYESVDTVIDTDDTIVIVDDNGFVQKFTDRKLTKRGQTPQGFLLGVLKKLILKTTQDQKNIATCDCSHLNNILPNIKIGTIEGNRSNLKITNRDDLFITENYISNGIDSSEMIVSFDQLSDYINQKNVLIIGGSSGIGYAISELAKSMNANTFITSKKNGVDINNYESIQRHIKDLVDRHGNIDCLVNTTGILKSLPIHLSNPEQFAEQVITNLVGTANVAMAAFQTLKKTKGMLINFGSSSYSRGRKNYLAYSSSKAGVVNFSQGLSEEWAPFNISVNCICPERTLTPMRIKNFGVEPKETLLSPHIVALATLKLYCEGLTGVVLNVKK